MLLPAPWFTLFLLLSTLPLLQSLARSRYLIEELKQQTVSQLQYRSWASGAVDQQICFKIEPLQCLRGVPQRLMYLTIIYDRSLADRWTSAHCLDVSTFYEAFLRMCASYVIVVKHIIFILKISYIMIVSWDSL